MSGTVDELSLKNLGIRGVATEFLADLGDRPVSYKRLRLGGLIRVFVVPLFLYVPIGMEFIGRVSAAGTPTADRIQQFWVVTLATWFAAVIGSVGLGSQESDRKARLAWWLTVVCLVTEILVTTCGSYGRGSVSSHMPMFLVFIVVMVIIFTTDDKH